MSKVLIGYVKKWNYLQEDIKIKLAGEPKEGSIYRIVYEDNSESSDKVYQIYIGKDSNPSRMDTIFLGTELSGAYYDKWEFEINVINKDNYLDFDYKPEELPILKKWLDSDNEDLKELLSKSPRKVDLQRVEDGPAIDLKIHEALQLVAKSAMEYDKSMERMGKALTIITERDTQLSLILSELLTYISSTYKDKYEASGRPNMAKNFLFSSDSSDATIFNSLKYLQRYSTKGFTKSGKVVDIHKAIHYLLFELQRSKNQKTNDKN